MTELEQLRLENKLLREKVDLLLRKLFGAKSEKLSVEQLELLLGEGLGKAEASPGASEPEAEATEVPKTKTDRQQGQPKRDRIPEHLPVVERIIDPDCVKACPEAWRYFGEEVSEQLDFEPCRFLRLRIVRRKYVKRADPQAPPVIAPLPPKLVERAKATPGLLAHIAVSKFQDHLPLYRQEQIYKSRHGVEIARQTMARWMESIADWLLPIYREIGSGIGQSGYLQVDETPVRYLEPGTGKAKQGYFWIYHIPGGDTFFDWQTGRGQDSLEKTIPRGEAALILQSDGYRVYPTFAASRGNITLAACWAHVRRKFHEALPSPGAADVLLKIGGLYDVEATLRAYGASSDERLEVRQRRCLGILDELHAMLTTQKEAGHHLPKSQMGKALNYALEHWDRLLLYTTDGRIEIDNNLAENQIRPTAVGKKNWLFIGAGETGWRSAVIYTILACCRNHGIEPYGYLKSVLEILPTATNWQIPSLTPAAWAHGRSLQEERKIA